MLEPLALNLAASRPISVPMLIGAVRLDMGPKELNSREKNVYEHVKKLRNFRTSDSSVRARRSRAIFRLRHFRPP